MADMKPIICGKPRLYVPETGCEDCLKQRDVVAGSNVSVTYNGDGTVTVNAEPGDLSNYYTKDETYTKTEVDELVEALDGFNVEVVDTLPATGEERTIYLVPKSGGTGKDEYLWINNAWEKIGDTDVDLSNYYNKTQVDNLLANKVDKVTGKGLSTNDYTTAEKTKLAGIQENAEVNVQSDWNVTDSSSDAFIKNKPTIPDVSNFYTKTQVDTALGNKVDKVSGKGLSTNDYTNADKTKLDGITWTKAGILALLGYKETTINMTDIDGNVTTRTVLIKE